MIKKKKKKKKKKDIYVYLLYIKFILNILLNCYDSYYNIKKKKKYYSIHNNSIISNK